MQVHTDSEKDFLTDMQAARVACADCETLSRKQAEFINCGKHDGSQCAMFPSLIRECWCKPRRNHLREQGKLDEAGHCSDCNDTSIIPKSPPEISVEDWIRCLHNLAVWDIRIMKTTSHYAIYSYKTLLSIGKADMNDALAAATEAAWGKRE